MRQIAVGAIVSGANPIPRKPRGRSGGGELRHAARQPVRAGRQKLPRI